MTLHSITGYETLKFNSRADVDGGYGAVFAPPSGPGYIPFPVETADLLLTTSSSRKSSAPSRTTPARCNGLAACSSSTKHPDRQISFNSLAPGNPQNAPYAQQFQTPSRGRRSAR
jgi:iron complex outermembrane receptor protein